MDLKEHRNESIEEEADNWWIRTRTLYVAKAISMLPNSKTSVLDFGCGTGVNSYVIQNRKDVGAVEVVDS